MSRMTPKYDREAGDDGCDDRGVRHAADRHLKGIITLQDISLLLPPDNAWRLRWELSRLSEFVASGTRNYPG